MKNITIIAILICIMFSSIYLENQSKFLNILMDPEESEYGVLNNQYDGYLVADTESYIEVANNIDENIDGCVVFGDLTTEKAIYTKECDSVHDYMKSESQKFNEKKDNVSTEYYNNIYEYLYGIKSMRRIDTLNKDEPFVHYSEIYVPEGTNMGNLFPTNLNYTKMNYIYKKYSTEFVYNLFYFQTIVLGILILIELFYVVYKFIISEKKVYSVYQLLGVRNKEIIKLIVQKCIFILSFSFCVSFFLYLLIVFFNGKLFDLQMYFEYFSLFLTIKIYICSIILIIPISVLLLLLINVHSLEKRVK